MRLWSLHPKYLDRQGLVALWREGLGARVSIRGGGYSHHPQLERFNPVTLELYLLEVCYHAVDERAYRFDIGKLDRRIAQRHPHPNRRARHVSVTAGQLEYERQHINKKLRQRSPDWPLVPENPEPHPLMYVVPGPVESWERVKE